MSMSADKSVPAEGGPDQDQEQRRRVDRPTHARAWDAENMRKLVPIVGPEEAPEELEDKPSVKDVLSKSYFDEPRWPIRRVLRWVARRKVEGLTDDYDSRRFRAIMLEVNDGVLVSKNPPDDLVDALRAGRMKAIGPEGDDLHVMRWDKVLAHDLRTWPDVWFRREDVLREFPAASPKFASALHKRMAVDEAIRTIGVAALERMSQKERELTIKEHVAKAYSGLSVTDRYVRKRWSLRNA